MKNNSGQALVETLIAGASVTTIASGFLFLFHQVAVYFLLKFMMQQSLLCQMEVREKPKDCFVDFKKTANSFGRVLQFKQQKTMDWIEATTQVNIHQREFLLEQRIYR